MSLDKYIDFQPSKLTKKLMFLITFEDFFMSKIFKSRLRAFAFVNLKTVFQEYVSLC